MEFNGYYLAQHKNPSILYVLGLWKEPKELISTLKMSNFKEFFLLLEDDYLIKDIQKILIKKLDEKTYKSIIFVDYDEAVDIIKNRHLPIMFDNVYNISFMIRLIKHKPSSLFGLFDRLFSTFKLWEIAKDYVSNIQLAKTITDYKNDLLSWTKDEDNDIELSVILPVYNVSKYLRKCISTVTAWDAPYVEFLFVDDGSPDDSAKVIKSYAKKDKRIKLLSKENGGCASAREYGMAHAKGRYIGFVDPDDFVDETMFEKLLSSAMMGTYDISYCRYNEYYESDGTSMEVDDYCRDWYKSGTSDLKEIDDLIAYMRVAIWRSIFRKEFVVNNDIHFYTDLKRFDDLPFKVETIARAKSVVCVDEALYYYRLGRPGQDVSVHDKRLYVHFDIFKHLDEFFKKPRRSEQLMHYHQVKVQTHYWAIINLDDEYKKEYMELAAKDLQIKNTKHSWKKEIGKYFAPREQKIFKKAIS